MIKDIGLYYIYRHIRLDKNEPFYIGIGTKQCRSNGYSGIYTRAQDTTSRNKIWKNIINKTEYIVEIILESDDYDFIKKKEIEFITLYGRIDIETGILANLTDGGEGMLGRKASKEERERRSEMLKAKHAMTPVSENTRLKISKANKGRKRSIEYRLHCSMIHRNKKHSEETKKKMSESHRGKGKSKEAIENQRKTIIPQTKRLQIFEYLLEGKSLLEIQNLLNTTHSTIKKVASEFGLSLDFYSIKREDGMKFKTEKEACEYMKVKKGTISAAISNGYKSKKFNWSKIREYIYL